MLGCKKGTGGEDAGASDVTVLRWMCGSRFVDVFLWLRLRRTYESCEALSVP